MKLGKKVALGALTVGLSFGGLALGGCGSTPVKKDGADAGGTGATDGTKAGTGGTGTTSGGERKPAGSDEHLCGAGSCGKLRLEAPRE